MNKINFQKELEKIIDKIKDKGNRPRLLLHSCCAPCSSYVLEYLCKYFDITVFYYNPNIFPEKEHELRYEELKRLVHDMKLNDVDVIYGGYDTSIFYKISKHLESEQEGGNRCFSCYNMRLMETAKIAKKDGFDYFTTTLTVSPYKNAFKLNEIGKNLSCVYGVPYLFSDFKKRNGYKRSIELSKKYSLYRQNYCGCIYSKISKANTEK